MRKLKAVLSAVLVSAAVIGLGVHTFKSHANEIVNNETDGDYENRFDMDVAEISNMLPVFTAIGARMDYENCEYALTDEFVANAMGYITYYGRDMLADKYTEDEENIYVEKDIFDQLAKTAFYKYDIESNKALNYNADTDSYIIKKDELCKKYSAEIVSVVNIDGKKDGEFYNTYEVIAKIKKGLFTDVEMKFTLEDNEYVAVTDGYLFNYAVKDVEIIK